MAGGRALPWVKTPTSPSDNKRRWGQSSQHRSGDQIGSRRVSGWSFQTCAQGHWDITLWYSVGTAGRTQGQESELLLPKHYFANKGPSSQSYGFSSGHVWMWELDCEESWVLKNGCFWTVVLEKTLQSPLDCKEIQPVHSEDQPWDFFGRNDAKAETPVLWPPHAKSWLIGKDSDAGRDLGWEEKGTTEDEMAGWHHWLDVRESEWTPGVGDGQGGLAAAIHGVAKSRTRLSD